jgi:hypothetical protein
MQMVIGNILDRRKTEVTLVTRSATEDIRLTKEQVEAGLEIEELIIANMTESKRCVRVLHGRKVDTERTSGGVSAEYQV